MIKSKNISIVSVGDLVLHPMNMNVHTDKQIDRLRQLIRYQGFRVPLVVRTGSNEIAAGNGRFIAAKLEGYTELPVIYQDFENDEQLYAFMVSDNAIQSREWGGGLDLGMINAELANLGPDFDIDLLGIEKFTLEPFEKFDIENEQINDENKKFIIEVTFPNDMEMNDIKDDLLFRGYIVKVK